MVESKLMQAYCNEVIRFTSKIVDGFSCAANDLTAVSYIKSAYRDVLQEIDVKKGVQHALELLPEFQAVYGQSIERIAIKKVLEGLSGFGEMLGEKLSGDPEALYLNKKDYVAVIDQSTQYFDAASKLVLELTNDEEHFSFDTPDPIIRRANALLIPRFGVILSVVVEYMQISK